jgi:hypothetical protein
MAIVDIKGKGSLNHLPTPLDYLPSIATGVPGLPSVQLLNTASAEKEDYVFDRSYVDNVQSI